MREENNRKNIIYAIVFAVIVGIVALVVFLSNYKIETHTYEPNQGVDTSSLVCASSDNEAAFFNSETAYSVEHKIKIIYSNGVIDKIAYEYEGVYDSTETAEHDNAVLHARYNTYLGQSGIDGESLTPVFQTIDNKMRINLYLDSYRKMNSAYGKLFYIENSNMSTIAKESLDRAKKIYENKGFVCEKQN